MLFEVCVSRASLNNIIVARAIVELRISVIFVSTPRAGGFRCSQISNIRE